MPDIDLTVPLGRLKASLSARSGRATGSPLLAAEALYREIRRIGRAHLTPEDLEAIRAAAAALPDPADDDWGGRASAIDLVKALADPCYRGYIAERLAVMPPGKGGDGAYDAIARALHLANEAAASEEAIACGVATVPGSIAACREVHGERGRHLGLVREGLRSVLVARSAIPGQLSLTRPDSPILTVRS